MFLQNIASFLIEFFLPWSFRVDKHPWSTVSFCRSGSGNSRGDRYHSPHQKEAKSKEEFSFSAFDRSNRDSILFIARCFKILFMHNLLSDALRASECSTIVSYSRFPTVTPKKATEALKILAGIENSLCGNMIIYDGLRASTRTIRLRPRRPECKLCGEKREIMELIDYVQFCGMAANDKDKGLNLVPPDER